MLKLKIRVKSPEKLFEKRETTADGFRFSDWDVISGLVREVHEVQPDGSVRSGYRRWKLPKGTQRLLDDLASGVQRYCGAKTRKGLMCKQPPLPGRTRCKYHGGLSTGPKTEDGREAIRASNRRRAKQKKADSI